jgi:hypothetical protein
MAAGQALLPVHFARIVDARPIAEAAADACGKDRQECLCYGSPPIFCVQTARQDHFGRLLENHFIPLLSAVAALFSNAANPLTVIEGAHLAQNLSSLLFFLLLLLDIAYPVL